jgi:hypothetical protein
LLTLAQLESSLDSVADTEGAGVLGDGEGLTNAGTTDLDGGVLLVIEPFVNERMATGDCADGGGL